MNEHTTLRGGDEGYGNSRGLTRQGPLELPYVRISSWALNPSSCDSTQLGRVGITDNVAVLGHFRPELSRNIATTWTHAGTSGGLGMLSCPVGSRSTHPTFSTTHPGRSTIQDATKCGWWIGWRMVNRMVNGVVRCIQKYVFWNRIVLYQRNVRSSLHAI